MTAMVVGVDALLSPHYTRFHAPLKMTRSSVALQHLFPPQGFDGGSGGGSGVGTKTATTKSKKNNKNAKTRKTTAQTHQSTQQTTKPIAMTAPSTVSPIFEEYQPPTHRILKASVDFDIQSTTSVIVSANMTIQPMVAAASAMNNNTTTSTNLVLNGDASRLDLREIRLVEILDDTEDGDAATPTTTTTATPRVLQAEHDYTLDDTTLTIYRLPNNHKFVLQTVVHVTPSTSTTSPDLSGLYCRQDALMTHCEPTGFSQITYWLDRPDVLTVFDKVKIEASRTHFPVLLSNGNRIDSGLIPRRDNCKSDGNNGNDSDDRHYVIYHDPHPKPAYIFGLVAAKHLQPCVTGTHVTASGRSVNITIYSENDARDRLQFAMDTIIGAMQWDETMYGLMYDLDEYNVVAVSHYHIGAMENKGLNFFQTSLIATHPNITTDVTYDLVEKTIGHEYLHNWSGNRVTVQSWREFSLKEGLTVFRDQEFTADVGLASTVRIEAIKILREKQFHEDATPALRHAVRPQMDEMSSLSQTTLDSLASSTTYHKGAEVCRLFKTVLGTDGFVKGLKLYMDRHDGSGATWDDFRDAMADANAMNLDQLGLWYSTSGTPTVSYSYTYNAESKKFTLTLEQNLECDPNVPDTLLHIPVSVGLLEVSGREVIPTTVLNLKGRRETFEFEDVANEVVPSILRDFSAPVILVPEDVSQQQERDLSLLARFDSDCYNRWEAMQRLFTACIFAIMRDENSQEKLMQSLFDAFCYSLNDLEIDAASKAYLLRLPTESVLSRQLDTEDPVGVHHARLKVGRFIHSRLKNEIRQAYDDLTKSMPLDDVRTDALSRATRSLRNVLLDYLCFSDDSAEAQIEAAQLALTHFDMATCFTDRLEAFRNLASMTGSATSLRQEAVDKFYQYARLSGPTAMNKWFQVQALSDLPDVLDNVQRLTQHPDFRATNAGRFRSLVTSFTMNAKAFHTERGYHFIGSVISQMDRVSPQLAVELTNKFSSWRRHPPDRQTMMKNELRSIGAATNKKSKLSPSLSMAINRALEG